MKLIYFFCFLTILSCTTVKKEYVCGDHPCIDKKEFNEYFSKNLIIEIKPNQKKKNKTIDLIKLNTESSDKKNITDRVLKKEKKRRLKNEKKELKAEKIILQQERKIRESEEKKIAQMTKVNKSKKIKISEVSNNREDTKKIVEKIPLEKKIIKENTNMNTSNNSVKNNKVKSICDEIKDCDIDKIAELLIKKGKDKPFPNIGAK